MIGKRCQLSQEAKKRGLKTNRYRDGILLQYVGKVVGESDDGKCWSVIWDGLRHPRPLDKALIEMEGGS